MPALHKIASLSLRTKTLLMVTITLVSLIALLYVISRTILLDSFSALETAHTHERVLLVQTEIGEEFEHLEAVVGDWAPWTDTYDFVQGNNDAYVEDNLMDDTFANLRINLMAFLDRSAELVYAKNYDLQHEVETDVPAEVGEQLSQDSPLLHHEVETDVPAELDEHLSQDNPLLHHEDLDSSVTGLLLLPEAPLLVAARPITTNDLDAESAGTLVAGRYLDAERMEEIAEKIHLPLTSVRLDDAPLAPDFQTALAALSSETPIFVSPLSDETISGYFLLHDIMGKPALLVRVDNERTIYRQGQDTLAYLVASVTIVGLVFIMVILILLETSVLARLASITTSVWSIGQSADRSARVPVPQGHDELWRLATTINEMLNSLKKSETLLQESTVLLKEIHHRIKNNLQVISSLLALQSGRNDHNTEFLKDTQNRIQSIALVHEKLYNSTQLSLIDLGDYVRSLVDKLKTSILVSDAVRVNVSADSIVMDMDRAAPIGLILNELITNALKYAFPDGRAGEINIELRVTGDQQYIITVRDNGIGLPENMDIRRASTLGLQLVNGLAKQMNGTVEFRCDGGTIFEVRFPEG